MERLQRKPASLTITTLVDQLSRQLKISSRKAELITGNEYKQIDTGIKAVSVNVPFAQMSTDWHIDLKKPAIAFVVTEVMAQLRMYNMLWHRPRSNNGQERQIMADLKKVGLIFPTETTDLFIVNPFKLWRGTIAGTIVATKHLLDGKAPQLSMIKDLKAPDKSELKTLAESIAQAMYNANDNQIIEI